MVADGLKPPLQEPSLPPSVVIVFISMDKERPRFRISLVDLIIRLPSHGCTLKESEGPYISKKPHPMSGPWGMPLFPSTNKPTTLKRLTFSFQLQLLNNSSLRMMEFDTEINEEEPCGPF